MRILLHSRSFPPALGGLEQFGLILSRELTRLGHRVTVATDVPSSAPDRQDFEVLRAPSPSGLLRAARRADLVHANGFSAQAFPIAAAARRPLVFTHQGYQASCLNGLGWHDGHRCGFRLTRCARLTARERGLPWASRQLVRHALSRAAAPFAAAHVAISAFVRDVLGMPNSHVVPNAADRSIFRPGPAARPRERFLFVGRFVAEKGVDVLLRAVARCEELGEAVAVDLVGAGPLEQEYARTIRELRLEGSVRLCGPMRGPALAQAMRDSLAVVVPSTYEEPFGIVAAEAICCGRRAIVSDAGGLAEVVAGLDPPVAAGDAEALARALVAAQGDAEVRREVEGRALLAARRFDERECARAYARVYEDVLGGAPSSG